MMRSLLRSFLLLAVTIIFLYFMQEFGLLRGRDIVSAFVAHPKTIIGICLLQVVTAAVMMFRYWMLLNVFGINTRVKQASAATFVSTALGQWFPGSLAVMEVLRISLMFGSDAKSDSRSDTKDAGIRGRLAIVSLVDRLVGFLGILIMGFVFSAYTWFRLYRESDAVHTGVLFLLLTAGGGVVALSALPFVARLKMIRSWLQGAAGRGPKAKATSSRFARIFAQLEHLRHDVEAGTRHPKRLMGPIVLSMISMILTVTGLFMAARALSVELDYFQIVCVFPIVSLASTLPLGFAGIGGYQLVMASVFSIFSVSPQVVTSAGVLQSALVLVANTALGLAYFRVCSAQIRGVFQRRAAAPSG